MRVTGPLDVTVRGGIKTFAVSTRPVEKPNAASELCDQRADVLQNARKPVPHLQIEPVSQAETSHFDPFWDGPRLVPSFVTQLLGQVMPERREIVLVETAYGSAIPRKALLVDRKS